MADLDSIVSKVKSNPQDASAWLELANTLSALGREKEAVYSRAQALKILQTQVRLSQQPPLPPANNVTASQLSKTQPRPMAAPKIQNAPRTKSFDAHFAAFADQFGEWVQPAQPVIEKGIGHTQVALVSFFVALQHYAPLALAWSIAKIQEFAPILLKQIAQALLSFVRFIFNFLFRGSGTIHPLLRLYYIGNLIITPIFLLYIISNRGPDPASPGVQMLVVWLFIAILIDGRARTIAWNGGYWLAQLLFQAIGGLSGGCIAMFVSIIICYIIFVYALGLALVLGAICLWFIAVYELGKDLLSSNAVSG